MVALLILFLSLLAFALNSGSRYLVINELQNSADAAALGGAGRLAGPLEPSGAFAWLASEELAVEMGARNLTLSGVTPTVEAEVGYWNIETKALSASTATPGPRDFPAVRVVASRRKDDGKGVPIFDFLEKSTGRDFFDVSANSLAIISGPGYVDRRDLFAFAISRCVYDQYWDYSRTPPGPRLINGNPPVFRLGRGAGADPLCEWNTIVWTALTSSGNISANLVATVVSNYQSTLSDSGQFAIGDPLLIWRSNVAQSVHNAIASCFDRASCTKVVVPVVSDVPSSNGSSVRPIQAFACLTIRDATRSGGGYVDVAMDITCPPPPSSGGIGPIFGTITPPALVQ